jgi:hypothetical protein
VNTLLAFSFFSLRRQSPQVGKPAQAKAAPLCALCGTLREAAPRLRFFVHDLSRIAVSELISALQSTRLLRRVVYVAN